MRAILVLATQMEKSSYATAKPVSYGVDLLNNEPPSYFYMKKKVESDLLLLQICWPLKKTNAKELHSNYGME